MRILHGSEFGLFIRRRITNWPGYQQVPQSRFTHALTAKLRVILSLVSETLRMDRLAKEKIRATRKLRGSESTEVLLIGNGPSSLSLNAEQIRRFRGTGGKIAVMNSFFRSSLAELLEPDYYFVGDPELWAPAHQENMSFRSDFQLYIENLSSPCLIMQPANQPPIVPNYGRYIYGDPRSVAGVLRMARPDRPWGLPASIAMVAIATLRYLGHQRIYFTGLDSNMHNFFFIDHKNEILFDTNGYHSYSVSERGSDRQEPNAPGVQRIINDPVRHMADLLYAQGIFLRDLYWLCDGICINVGNDETNDAAPRACLLK